LTLVFQTSRGYIIFYEVQLDNANKQATLFAQKEHRFVEFNFHIISMDHVDIFSL